MKIALVFMLFNASLCAVYGLPSVCSSGSKSVVQQSSYSSSKSVSYISTDYCSSLGITVRDYIPSLLLQELETQILEAKCRYLSRFDRYPMDIGPLLHTYSREELYYDMVVVGAGSAVLNSLYSLGQLNKRILVIDQGFFPPQICNSLYYRPKLYHTDFVTRYPVNIPGCKVPKYVYSSNMLGGISSLNDNSFLIPPSCYYKQWNKFSTLWGWEKVAKYYSEMQYTRTERTYEEHTTVDKDCYGRIYVSKKSKETYSSTQITKAYGEMGYAVSEYNYENIKPGFYTVPSISDYGRNVLAAEIFLESVKQYSNIQLSLNSYVERLEFEGEICKRVILRINGKEVVIYVNDHVIMGTGPINTYSILARSGVGVPDVLQSCGIKPIIPLPYLGQQFGASPIYLGMCMRFPAGKLIQDFGSDYSSLEYLFGESTMSKAASLSFYNAFFKCGGSQYVNVRVRTYVFSRTMVQRFRSYLSGMWQFESHIVEYLCKEVLKYDIMMFGIEQLDVRSRGVIRLNSDLTPLIDLNMYQDQYDIKVMKDAITQLMAISQTSIFKQYNAEFVSLPLTSSDSFTSVHTLSTEYITQTLPYFSVPSIAPFGAVVMGSDISTSVVNENLLTWGTKNLLHFGDGIFPVSRWGDSIASSLLIGKYGSSFISNYYKTGSYSSVTSSERVEGLSLSETNYGPSTVQSSEYTKEVNHAVDEYASENINAVSGGGYSEYSEDVNHAVDEYASENVNAVSGGGYSEYSKDVNLAVENQTSESINQVSNGIGGYSGYSKEASHAVEEQASESINAVSGGGYSGYTKEVNREVEAQTSESINQVSSGLGGYSEYSKEASSQYEEASSKFESATSSCGSPVPLPTPC